MARRTIRTRRTFKIQINLAMKEATLQKKCIDYILELRALGQEKIKCSDIATHLDISASEADKLLKQILNGDQFSDARLESGNDGSVIVFEE